MAKIKTIYRCTKCGTEYPKWAGKCNQCDSWNTLQEEVKEDKVISAKVNPSIGGTAVVKRLKDIETKQVVRLSTGIDEVDRVLGGGIIPDSLLAICAAPGSGKSTLLGSISNNIASKGFKVLYVSGEESDEQVKSRTERITQDNIHDNLYFLSTNSLNIIENAIKEVDAKFIVIDSIQTLYLDEFLPSRPGSPVQTQECANRLRYIAKGEKRAIFTIVQVTKTDEMAGSRQLEHAVDGVFYLEGDRKEELRILTSVKNRFGDTSEVGLLVMGERGLETADMSMFYKDREKPISGCALTVSLEGTRPVIIEIEALADRSFYPSPMRVPEGIQKPRLLRLGAIIEKKCKIILGDKDVYVNVTGGLKIQNDNAVDLSILMAIVSSAKDIPLDSKTAYLGGVGLTGELKTVTSIEKRLRELDRMGFRICYIPKGNLKQKLNLENLKVIEMNNVKDIINSIL